MRQAKQLRGRLCLHVALAALVVACSEPAEVRYETEHLRIAPVFDEPICAGELERYERHIAHAEAALQTQLRKPVTVYLWEDEQNFFDAGYCDAQAYGCYADFNRIIYSTRLGLDHELVHPVLAEIGDPAPFLLEGAVEMLRWRRTIITDVDPAAQIDRPKGEFDYQTAGHFSRWLWAHYGQAKFLELMRTNSKGSVAFESVYGLSIEAASELYSTEVPYAYAPLYACEYPVLPEVGPGHWSDRMTLDCDDPGTYGGPYGMGAPRVLEVETRADYVFTTSAEGFSISLCPDQDLLVEPEDGDPALGDVPPVTSGFREQYVRGLWGPEEHILDLVPGRYEVVVGQQDYALREVSLDIELHL